MNEPSQEAKQAAMTWLGEKEPYMAGYDTATAKAREELDVARAELFRRANQCAKLREALYILARGRWPDRMTQRELDTVNEALAHQPLDSARDRQQSAITTNEQAYRDGTISRVKEGETTTTQKGDKQESDIIR